MSKKYEIQDFLEVKSAIGPSFSPDGSRIAYRSNISGTFQIFLTDMNGGAPEQLTEFEDSVSFASFSPTRNHIIFGKSSGGNEQTQFFLLDVDTREIRSITSRPDVRHDIGPWSADGKRICFSSNERNGKDFDVYIMDIDTLEKECVFDRGGWCSAEGFSPDGTYLIARENHSNVNTDLHLCDLGSGEIQHLTPHVGDVFHGTPRWLPDESAFFFAQDDGLEFMSLARYVLTDKKFEYILATEWDIEEVAIDRKGQCLAVVTNEGGYSTLTLYDPRSLQRKPCKLPQGSVMAVRFSSDGRRLAFVVGSSRHALDVWTLDLESGMSAQLTRSPQGVPSEELVDPELVKFSSFDGLEIAAFIYRPKYTEPGVRIPVIIDIHGGPEAQYRPGYGPLTQYFAHQGYAVVGPNVRGSAGYGKTYLSLDNVEKRLDSVKDIVALREYLTTLPDVDTEKIVLMGGSYGGFMVLAGLAFYPDLWAAGVDTVGIVNFVTFLENTAPYRRALREAEYGSLEHDRELLEKISPIHSVAKIKAPLFVIHGANDPRVPLSEAEQVVAKLKELGREVEFLVYADEGHGLSKLKNRLDAYPKVVEFLKRVL